MLWEMQLFHDADKPADSLVAAIDAAITPLQTTLVDQATLDQARVKARSALYSEMEQFAGFGRANLLAAFALFDDDPNRINQLEQGFAAVTPALLQRTAQEYLRPTNRTIEFIVPAAKPATGTH
jgi:predicted Zn-dependent peptidase